MAESPSVDRANDLPDNTTVELAAGRSRAWIVPGRGGRLGQLDLGDGPLLRGWSPGRSWDDWGCYPLVPWSNRIPGGRFRVGGVEGHVPVNFPDGSAIHGLGADVAWTVAARDERSVVLVVELRAGPYEVRAELDYRLADDGLRVELAVEPRGTSPVPVGLGFHPWFHDGAIRVPADRRWPGEPLPTAADTVPVEGRWDLRAAVVPEPMDACFTGLTDTVAEVPGVRLRWSDPVIAVVVYSGEPGWVCVEPVTMANDGFGLAERGDPGHGVRLLEPGERLAMGCSFERSSLAGRGAAPPT